MAATITDFDSDVALGGSSPANVLGNTFSLAVGEWLLLCIAASNDGSGGASPFDNVTLSGGGGSAAATITTRANVVYDPGSAGAGANVILVTVECTGTITNGNLFANWNATPTEASCQAYKYAPGAGEAISFVAADGTGSTGNATTHSAPTVSVESGDTITGVAAIETDDTVSGDTDTTNGNWSSILSRLDDNGADASTMVCSSQYKTVNATGNQSWACTTSSGRDSARTYIVLRSATAGITGTLAKTLGTATLSANATVDVDATLSKTLGTLTSSANATVDIAATLNKTLGTLTASAAAEVTDPGNCSLSQTLGALAVSASASVDVDATLAKSLGTLVGVGNATVDIDATLAKTLGALTVSAAASVGGDATATLAQTLGTLTVSGAAAVDVGATLAKTLDSLTAAGVATVTIDAALAKTLGALALSGAATVSLEAQLSKTLGTLSVSANATVGDIVAASALQRTQPIQSLGRLNARM